MLTITLLCGINFLHVLSLWSATYDQSLECRIKHYNTTDTVMALI